MLHLFVCLYVFVCKLLWELWSFFFICILFVCYMMGTGTDQEFSTEHECPYSRCESLQWIMPLQEPVLSKSFAQSSASTNSYCDLPGRFCKQRKNLSFDIPLGLFQVAFDQFFAKLHFIFLQLVQ